jgi:hypothetical protein
MRVKIKFMPRKGGKNEVEVVIREVEMVQAVEARGHRSICTLLDLQDWDAAVRRLNEIGVTIRHHKNKPIVNIEEVKAASKKWFKRG